MNGNHTRPAIPCDECQAGHMHLEFVTYFTYLGDELITVPDFPAWRCDVCQRVEYDASALNRLSELLDPDYERKERILRLVHKPNSRIQRAENRWQE